MNHAISPEIYEVIQAVHYRPAVSIILPFEPKMSLKAEITQQLKFATDKVEKEIRQHYPAEIGALVIQKLRTVIKNLNFNTYKKSIAIYVSPVFEKVLYLDMEVEARITVDESFEIRDLIYAKKESQQYLVVLLSGKHSRVFAANADTFIRIKSNVPDDISAFDNDAPERVANFSDPSDHKEIMLKKFLHQTDLGLGFLLQAYPLPVFVAGPAKMLGYFKNITKNEKSIISYIHGNYDEATDAELKEILRLYVNDWKKVKQENLRLQMEKAADAGKLAIGIKDVWKQATQHHGHLLIVEKSFMYPAQRGSNNDVRYMPAGPYNKFSYIRDAVDDIIEKVLENGGDVEFVDDGMLTNYQRIVLTVYY